MRDACGFGLAQATIPGFYAWRDFCIFSIFFKTIEGETPGD